MLTFTRKKVLSSLGIQKQQTSLGALTWWQQIDSFSKKLIE
jgi:hypothetical protein